MKNAIELMVSATPMTPLPLGGIALVDKLEWVLSRTKDRSVLHLGPTDSPATQKNAEARRLLHQKLQGHCRELVGLDLDADCIEILRSDFGISDILHGNAEQLGSIFPDRKFDVVIAGDILEHVSNFGLVLEGVRKVLAPGGRLLITTPNALAIKRVLGALILRQERNNPDHLYFFSPMNLWQASARFGYRISEMASFMYSAPGDKMNARGNAGAMFIMRLTGNYALADELAAVFEPLP